ncbi:MAG: hypothetical protein JO051_03805, partial [Acidobacteriaceae bacterium]|nr:hypothetical protein [Acidobacteriaceae bacterium]
MKTFLLAIACAVTPLVGLRAANETSGKTPTLEVMQVLAAGDQKSAEGRLASSLRDDPRNPDFLFLNAILARSRFEVQKAAPGFAVNLQTRADSLEGLTSACVLGIDLSRNESSAIYYFNALLILCEQNPDSIPCHWLAGVMARTLTSHGRFDLGDEVHTRIMLCGVREYERVLALMAPGPGPTLVHQTMANLLGDLDGHDLALPHRQIALKLERSPWTLHGA